MILAFLYLVEQLLMLVGVFLAAWLIAKGLFVRSLKLSVLEELGLLVPAGLGVMLLLFFLLGVLGVFSLASTLLCLLVLVIISLYRLKSISWEFDLAALKAGFTPSVVLLCIVALVLLVPVMLLPLTPPLDSDEIRYHLAYAYHVAEQGSLEPNLYLRYPFFSLNIDLLYAFCLLIGDDITTHFMHMSLGLMTALNLYNYASRVCGRFIAFASVLLFCITPVFIQMASTAYIDLGLACFVFATFAALSYCNKDNCRAVMLCSALLFGIALGSKYLALAYLPLMLVWAWFHMRNWRGVVKFMILALLVGAPWYIFNMIHTGNPVHPFLGKYFGYWPWNESDESAQVYQLIKGTDFGIGKSWVSFVRLPYEMWRDGEQFQLWHPMPVLMFLLFPIYLYFPFWDKKLKPAGIVLAVVFIGWFSGAQIVRYLMAFLPLWSMLVIWGYIQLLVWMLQMPANLLSRYFSFSKNRVWQSAALITLLSTGAFYVNNELLLNPNEAAYMINSRDQFLRDRIPEYKAIEYINSQNYSDEVILQYESGSSFSFIRNNWVVGDWFGLYRFSQFFQAESIDAAIEQMRDTNVTLLLINKSSPNLRSSWLSRIQASLPLEYEDEKAVVLRVQAEKKAPIIENY